ncbi:MAG: hypothetical protein M1825_003157 [Sarcosagium campestre]|nr:MAG: hypothetical protein M1825_003157 [Sarcosagium campestre]
MAKHHRQTVPKGRDSSTTDTITDPRFSNIHTDPRFRIPSRKHRHVELDERFSHMLKDDNFSRKASVDKYGRKISKGTGKKELERFYRIGDRASSKQAEESDEESDEDAVVEEELAQVNRKYDPAREGGFSSSSEDSEQDSDSDDVDAVVEEDDDDDPSAVPDMQIDKQVDVPVGEVSSRLAVVNLDWDNIRAVDLMAVFSSFCPPTGSIKSISIYPSEFGRERIEREDMEGPPSELFRHTKPVTRDSASTNGAAPRSNASDASDGSDSESDEHIKKSLVREDAGEEVDGTKLRRYQLERMRYFYAVLIASSPATAKAIYDATDGTEYLTTANFFDLRFVPDDVSFADDRPRDECFKLPESYKPNTFVTDALQHSKVKLTWDADDNVRKDVVRKAFSGSRAELDENELKAYLGSSSSSSDDDEAEEPAAEVQKPLAASQKAASLRTALGLSSVPAAKRKSAARTDTDADVAPVGDMQITFTSGLSTNNAEGDDGKTKHQGSVFENSPADRDETTVEMYKRKEKERKNRRRERAKGLARTDDRRGATNTPGHKDDDEDATEDLGFDDPFFTSATSTTTKTKKNNQKSKSKAADKDAKAEEKAARKKQRDELSLLLVDDDHNNSNNTINNPSKDGIAAKETSHFSMSSILKAEKESTLSKKTLKKKQKTMLKNKRKHNEFHSDDDNGDNTGGGGGIGGGGKGGSRAREDGLQQGFDIDVTDPRFARLYENPDFAVDPSSARFRDTKAMRKVLEEGRKRRRRGDTERDEE